MNTTDMILHATCVAIAGDGVLIIGPSCSGKSSLALHLMAMDAVLVSDDRTVLCREGATLVASAPSPIAGLIEARSVGIIKVPHLARAPVTLAIDMARIEKTRLPDHHSITLLDIELRCLHKVDASYFPAAIHAYVTGMRKENT